MNNDFELNRLKEKLNSVDGVELKQRIVWQWIKQNHINLRTYIKLNNYIYGKN